MPQLSLHSPIGDLTLTEEDGAIVSLDWGWGCQQQPTPLLEQARLQLEEYFDGKRRSFDLPLAPTGTAYQRKVWDVLQRIPYGGVARYGLLAQELGSAARAVGGRCADCLRGGGGCFGHLDLAYLVSGRA